MESGLLLLEWGQRPPISLALWPWPWFWASVKGPSSPVAASPFCDCFLPPHPDLLPMGLLHPRQSPPPCGVLPISEPHSPEPSWGPTCQEPGSSRCSLSEAQMPSERLQDVKPTQPERGQGVASPPTVRPLVRGPRQESGRRPGTPGSLVGKDSHRPFCASSNFCLGG